MSTVQKIEYVKPQVIDLGTATPAFGDCKPGTGVTGDCTNGTNPGSDCSVGYSPPYKGILPALP